MIQAEVTFTVTMCIKRKWRDDETAKEVSDTAKRLAHDHFHKMTGALYERDGAMAGFNVEKMSINNTKVTKIISPD